MVISLREHISRYEEALADTITEACRAMLGAFAEAGSRAVPVLAESLHDDLLALQQQFSSGVSPDDVRELQGQIKARLAKWGDDSAQASLDNLNQIRDVMMAVASSAAAIANRDHRYATRLSNLQQRFQTVARITSIDAMRRTVIESAAEMKSCVEEMAQESAHTITRLKAEVAQYRADLKAHQKQVSTDALTGLLNRVAIDACIEERIAWSSTFCLVVMDLNGFKDINDTYGHSAGDDLLKQFSHEVRARLRSTDTVGRWGGDEFVLLIDSSLTDARASVDRLCGWVFGRYVIESGGEPVSVTISAAVGVVEWDGAETATEMFDRADKLMYSCKKAQQ